MFASKAAAYPSGVTFRDSTLRAVYSDIIIGWKGMPGTNTLA